jgi:hypothetical protein
MSGQSKFVIAFKQGEGKWRTSRRETNYSVPPLDYLGIDEGIYFRFEPEEAIGI